MFPAHLTKNLRLPVIGAPMFRVSGPDLVVGQCRAGVIGAFPALNARSTEGLREWLTTIKTTLATEASAAPFAVNLILNKSNERLEADLDAVCEAQVPIVITSLGAREDVYRRVKDAGGMVLHDVTTVNHARKAIEKGADGLIAVCAGAGGHGGTLTPFAFAEEIRRFWDGPLALGGGVSSGQAVHAAKVLGADLAYVGTAFIMASESMAEPDYHEQLLASTAADITYTPLFSGVPANYLSSSIRKAGLDPNDLPVIEPGNAAVLRQKGNLPKAWKEILAAGQGVGATRAVVPAAEIIDGFYQQYMQARGTV